MSSDNLKVAVRVRPFNQRETQSGSKCIISMRGTKTRIYNPTTSHGRDFTFDFSYWSHEGFREEDDGQLVPQPGSKYADQATVFKDLGEDVLKNAWNGYNATLFAYGQTGSGKSYSMLGYGSNRGIVPLACNRLFDAIDKFDKSTGKEFQVAFSMMEIYNEQIRDLLAEQRQQRPTSRRLKIRERGDVGFYVEGLSQHPCRSYKTINKLMQVGAINRTTAATNMNATSSRSHMVVTIKFSQIFNNDAGESTTKVSEINLVDLAGSERAQSTGATGDRLKEGSAINTSLLTLGNVIETLAAADPRAVVPYRNSVLTKLLKSALGGNSKTVMIASLSPADINYEETLSTLRYANRAKKIKNRAIVNENPTEKLIRQLKEENARLLKLISGRSPNGASVDNDDIQRLITQNEWQMKEMTTSWQERLEQERRKWEEEHRRDDKWSYTVHCPLPYLQNVNEDPQLSGVIRHVIHEGETVIGRCKECKAKHCITLQGLGIQEEHCVVSCTQEDSVILEPKPHREIYVNGKGVTIPTVLQHGDRLKFGSNAFYLYIGFPSQRKNDENTVKRFDFDFFQNELASTFALSRQKDSKPSKTLTYDQVFLEYIELLPVVASVNAMSQEMGKNIEFSLVIENLATHDEEGREKVKSVLVKVRHVITNQTWMWPRSKFANRRYLIEDLYLKFQDDPSVLGKLSSENDPFWDPVEDVYIGCAHVWMYGLAHCLKVDEQLNFYDHSGDEKGLFNVSLTPCTPTGRLKGDEELVQDPNELLGKRFDLVIEIPNCFNLNWIQENSTRGVALRFKFFSRECRSSDLWCSISPAPNFKQQVGVKEVDEDFLSYLQTCALVVELWGLQAGKYDRDQISDAFPQHPSNHPPLSPPSSVSSQQSDLETMEKEISLLRNKLNEITNSHEALQTKCNILKKENRKMKQSLRSQTIVSGERQTNTRTILANERSVGPLIHNGSTVGTNRVQAELGRALKDFFGDIRPVQSNLQTLTGHERRSNDIQLVSRDLDKALETLKRSVATAVRIHKQVKRKDSSLA